MPYLLEKLLYQKETEFKKLINLDDKNIDFSKIQEYNEIDEL
ncbi:MAG: hypothetical protein ACOZBL_02520 [Patescibacteria group bacterium]